MCADIIHVKKQLAQWLAQDHSPSVRQCCCLFLSYKHVSRDDAIINNVLQEGSKGNVLEGRKEMFYLTMHSAHFYLRLYGVRHIGKVPHR